MKKVACLLAVALTVVGLTALAAPSRPPAVEAMVKGGGTADFLDTDHSVNTTGYTNFSISATVYSGGGADGHFLCQVPGIVVISGDITEGCVNEDGSVSVAGLAHGYDHTIPGLFFDMPFTATFRAGGPGVGEFDYRDESGFFAPGQYDTERVRRGMILIVD
jgi:hypothetical protein